MDERYRFIRSTNPFENLKDYESSFEITMKKHGFEYPVQLTFSEEGFLEPGKRLTTALGRYYELLTQIMCGGKIKRKTFDNSVEPDLMSFKNNFLYEVKAVSPGAGVLLNDEQITKYAQLQLQDIFKEPPEIYFDIYRHGIKKPVKNFKKKNLEELVNQLPLNTKFMLSLPLSVMTTIHNFNSNYTSFYNGDKWAHFTRFCSSGLNAMLAYPEKTLQEFGLNPNDFYI